jgi:exo-beta-1,3-glucanase (GH17 family)
MNRHGKTRGALPRRLGLVAMVIGMAACASCGLDFDGAVGPDGDGTRPPVAGNPTPADGAAPSGERDASHVLGEPDAAGLDGAAIDADVTPGTRRQIPDDVLARKAIAYSGYRAEQSPETGTYPSEAEIREDLDLLTRGGWTFLRLFDSGTHAERVLKVIRDDHRDIKVALGIWIAGKKAEHDAENRDQIERCVALVSANDAIVASVSVGNETLDEWSSVRVPPAELAAYIGEVRARVNKPVTTDDMYLPFTLGQDGTTSYADVAQVARAIDYLSLHVYAFLDAPYGSWDWKQTSVPEGYGRAAAMMNAALAYTEESIASVRAAMTSQGLDLPIVIGEAGWKTSPAKGADEDSTEVFRAHAANQKMFYDRLMSWVYGAGKNAESPRAAFYFEAFDEAWKGDDNHWGLFDAKRNAKYVLWSAFPDRKPLGVPPVADTDAVYWKGKSGGQRGLGQRGIRPGR